MLRIKASYIYTYKKTPNIMNVRLWIHVLFLLFALPLNIFAQSEEVDTTRSNYALLWEITGNGLDAPSYLFGSMHVRYNAIFEFPDSLYVCLKACDAFANEVHLDSAMQRFYEVYYGRDELNIDSSYILLTAEKSEKTDSLDQLYEAANPAEEFDIRDFFKGLIRLDDIEERGFQRTMLDAHLMETARALDIKLYGLEDIDEHMYEPEYRATPPPTPLKSFLFGNSISTLLDIYYQGDIASIEKFMRASPGALTQLALIPRNYIMCNSMEDIMQDQKERLFTVVGAAHLPGTEGVIQILKDRGYTLRKIEATFTGLRDSFQVEDKARLWQKKLSDDQTYTFALPWSFEYQQIDGSASSYYAFDIGQGLNYLLMKTALFPNSDDNFDVWFFEDDGYEVIEKEEITHNDLDGFKYKLTRLGAEPEHYLGYTFVVDQELYYLQIGAYEEDELTRNANVAQFLEQFEVVKFNNGKWVPIVDTVGGFSVKLPSNYSYTRAYRNDTYDYAKPEDYPLHIYRAGFEEKKAAVWIQYYDQKAGSVPEIATDRLSEAKDELVELYGIEFEVFSREPLNGLPQWELNGQYPDLNINANIKLIVRGNRLYQISRFDNPSNKLTKKFLPSFKLLPLTEEDLVSSDLLADGQLICQLPANYTATANNLSYAYDYPPDYHYAVSAQDETAAANYQMDIYRLPSLFGVKDTTEVMNYALKDFLASTDSVYQRKSVTIQGKYPGIELYCDSPAKGVDQLVQVYIADNYWVRKKVYADSSYLFSKNVTAFFNNDIWQDTSNRHQSLVDRTDEITKAFSSDDSLKVETAFKAFSTELSINTENVSTFSDLLLNNNWEETHVYPDKIRLAIIEGIRLNAESPEEAISSLFERAHENKAVRRAILNNLSSNLTSKPAFKPLFFSLLLSDKEVSRAAGDYLFFPYLYDQVLFLEDWSYFESLLEAKQEPLFVWEAVASVLSNDSLDQSVLLDTEQQFINRTLDRLESNTLDASELIIILDLLEQLSPNASVTARIAQLFEQSSINEKTVLFAGYLLSQGISIPKRSLKEIIAKEELRVKMTRILNEYDQLKLLPKNGYDQLEIAQNMFLEKLRIDEIGGVSEVEFIGTQEVLYNGESKLVYVFSFKLDEQEDLLGMSGFFSTNRKEKAFDDNSWVNYTLYSISSRRRAKKISQLVQELENGPIEFDY